MGNLTLKGEYKITTTYQRMFSTYQSTFISDNLITDEGLEFLVGKWNDMDNNKITKIIIGTNNANPSPKDTITVFNEEYIFNVDVSNEKNRLIMTNNSVSGKHLYNTTEIGVIGEANIDDGNKTVQTLISRSTHPQITIPETSIISLEYTFTLKSLTIDECQDE